MIIYGYYGPWSPMRSSETLGYNLRLKPKPLEHIRASLHGITRTISTDLTVPQPHDMGRSQILHDPRYPNLEKNGTVVY